MKVDKTPKGSAHYLKVIKPTTQFDAVGVYEGHLILHGEDADNFKSIVDAEMVQAIKDHTKDGKKPKKADPPYKPFIDKDGQEDGVAFKFKMKSKYETRKGDVVKQKPVITDAKGTPITDPEFAIGNGSVVRIAFRVRSWSVASVGCGITMAPIAVQVIKLVPYSASSDGFDFEEEEGFEWEQGQEKTEGQKIFSEEEDDF